MSIEQRSLIEHTDSLGTYLPNGPLFEAKNINDSNFRKLLRGFAGEVFTGQGYIKSFCDEFIPDQTNLFLTEWEQALGIPDDCFTGTGTNDERRRDILVKLASLGVQTAQDFVDLAAIFGVTITVTPGIETATFPWSFPYLFFATLSDAKFTIVVTLPLPEVGFFPQVFPFIFGDATIEILKCLFIKLAPANCQVIFRSS